MNLYVDDNLTDPNLAGALRKAGHVVVRPADVQRSGASDARHLECAILRGLVVLTADRRDFWDLHDVVRVCGGHHPGILIVRFDNDRMRDMKPKHIVRAIANLEKAGIDPRDQLIVLNHWR
jgi:predicted nuclease of predicted toxin-antitoxin system